ncbi:hypothetical protein O181_050733 [Austropuccinia psidii MF-1]|uniref:Uncharacterized protein n=1 Tax=Austropuccinia psidii MF-1 TaxID=1389203 RepID=A0A9Q3E2A8_9BASI|nr:hypothetical protein [Austropuccinia psidii MF-1]
MAIYAPYGTNEVPFGIITMKPKGAKGEANQTPNHRWAYLSSNLSPKPQRAQIDPRTNNCKLSIESHGLWQPPEALSSGPTRLPLS